MEFQNLQRNILHVLSEELNSGGSQGPVAVSAVAEKLPGVPAEKLQDAMASLAIKGWLEISDRKQRVRPTRAGRSMLQLMQNDPL